MHQDHEAAASAATGGPEEAQLNTAVRFDERHDAPSGLWFRSFIPVTTPWARLALLHGYGDHGGRYGYLLNSLAENGISCSSLDFRGHGRSAGRRGYVRHWDEFLDDLDTFLAWEQSGYVQRLAPKQALLAPARARVPLFILGHSHGGLVAAVAGIGGRLGSAAGCILSSPYLRARTPLSRPWAAFAWVTSRVMPWIQVRSGLTAEMMSSDPVMQAEANGDPLLIHGATPRWYVQAVRAQARALCNARKFRLPLLCLFGDADPVADPRAAEQFVNDAGAADKTLVRYPGKLHELLRESGRDAIFQAIVDWMRARSRDKLHQWALDTFPC